MKRMVLAGLMFAGAIMAATAQVTVGGSVDMSVVPFQFGQAYDNDSSFMGAGIGGILHNNGPRIRLDTRAVNAEHGFGFRVRFEGIANSGTGNPTARVENFLQAWWSPTEWLRLDAGRFDDDRLRGRVGDDEMSMFSLHMFDHDQIFNRIRMRNGFMVSSTPAEGLLLAVGLRHLVNNDNQAPTGPYLVTTRSRNGDVWRNIHAAVGYTIDGVGLVRAQYIGDMNTAIADRVEVAFALTAVDGMVLDIGGKVPFAFDIAGGVERQNNFGASLGVRYDLGGVPLELAARVDALFGGGDTGAGFETSAAPVINAHLWPSFDLDFARLLLNFGVEWIGAETHTAAGTTTTTADGGLRLGVGLSLQRNLFGNSRVRGGVAYRFAGEVNGVQERGVFTIPLFFEYSF